MSDNVIPFAKAVEERVIEIEIFDEEYCNDEALSLSKQVLLSMLGEGFEITSDDPMAYDLMLVKEAIKSLIMRLNEMDYPLQSIAEGLYKDLRTDEILSEFEFSY
jgi:hypothetical protein